jgi:hypothetical protein
MKQNKCISLQLVAFYWTFISRCISMDMSLNETEHMYTLTYDDLYDVL